MKRFIILIIALVLYSSAYAGMEGGREIHPYHNPPHEQINPVSFPFDATLAIPHQYPTVAGGQNRYGPDRSLKLVSSTFSGLPVGADLFPSYKNHSERKNKTSVLRFILFRNLRL